MWQLRYREHLIRNDTDLQRHVDYIHFNPVKHGLVGRLADWPHSSFHRCVRQGLLPAEWAFGQDMATAGEQVTFTLGFASSPQPTCCIIEEDELCRAVAIYATQQGVPIRESTV